MKKTDTAAAQTVRPPFAVPTVAANDDLPMNAELRLGGDAAPPVAANDDAAPRGPRPAGAALGRQEPLTEEDAAALRADIAAKRAVAVNPHERDVLDGLNRVAGTGARLRGPGGRPALGLGASDVGVPLHRLDLGTPARAAWDLFSPRFQVVARDGVSAVTPRPHSAVEAVRHWLDEVQADPEGSVPAAVAGGISLRGVAKFAGVGYSALKRAHGALAEVRARVADGRVRLGPVYVHNSGMTVAQEKERLAELYAVADSFDVPGGKLPGALSYMMSTPSFERIAALTGRVEPTMEDDEAYNRHVRGIGKRRGVAIPGLELGNSTIASLRVEGVRALQAEQKAKGNATAGSVVANHTGALDRLVAAAGLTTEDEQSALFGPNYDDLLEKEVATFTNTRSAANFRRLGQKWKDVRLAVLNAADLPPGFGPAIGALIERRSATVATVAVQAAMSKDVLRQWVEGIAGPSEATLDEVGRLEVALGVPAGTLADRAGRVPRRLQPGGRATPGWRALDWRTRGLLPVEASEWPDERLAAAVAQVKPLLSKGTEHGARLAFVRTEDVRLPAFERPARLDARLDEFVAYKTAATAYPLARAANGRWASEGSVDMRMSEVHGFFRTAAAPLVEGPSAGLGLDGAEAVVAWLACPLLTLPAITARASRAEDFEWEGVRRGVVYSRKDVAFAELLASVTNPVTGWLAQRPDVGRELVPVERGVPGRFAGLLAHFESLGGGAMLSEADVALAQSDWASFVARAHRVYVQAVSFLDEAAEVGRNPMAPIAGLLTAEEPLAEWMALAFDAERCWAPEATSPIMHRLDVRDSVVMRLAPMTGFRPDNMHGLTFAPDGRGEIRRRDGVWEIEVGYRRFKNFRSCRLFGPTTARQNYHQVLQDEAGLYDLLDRWFFDCLPALAQDGVDRAFVSKDGAPLNANSYCQLFRTWGMHNVAWNPVKRTGFPGVVSVNPYSMRHLRATDTLKNGTAYNRVEEAALAIQTSEAMITQHYGTLIPKQALRDGSSTLSRALGEAWKRRRR